MEKLNLPPFYIGETVEYITGISMPKGTKVVVTGLKPCKCGCWKISFNGSDFASNYNADLWACKECGTIIHEGFVTPWWEGSSFRSLQQQSYPLMSFKEIVKKEKEEVLINN